MNAQHARFATLIALTMAFVLVTPSPASAQEGGGLGGLAQGLNPMNWKMPEFKMPTFKKLLPGSQEKDRIIEKKDGLMSEIGKSASNSWQRTKATLNPMNVLPIGNKSNVEPAAEKEPGFFSRLFSPPAAKEDSSTISSFLKQDRPEL